MTATTTQGRDPASLRRHNLRALLRFLHLNGATSRAELAEVTGLTRSAIADLTGELASRGLAAEGSPDRNRGSRGRPPVTVSPRSENAYVLAAAIEVETLRVSRVGIGGTVLDEAEEPHEYIPGDPSSSIEQLSRMLDGLLRTCDEPPRALGVAVPGLVRSSDELVLHAPNLGWTDLALGEELRRTTGLPGPVLIGNEARLAAIAENRRGAGRGCSNLVYISAEVGVGGGIITGNRVLTGHSGIGGEIGHMITRPGGRRCRCGRRGCWETEIGADALLRHAGVPASQERRAALNELLSDAERGNPSAVAAFRSLCTPVAFGLTNLCSIFDPERVVLGGLLEPLVQHAEEELRARLAEFSARPGSTPELHPAQLGPHGRLLGAAEAAFDSFIAALD
ncbi:ROK family protein [Saccharopolyspora rectivirgula]|uniref:ROK family protein n=1 Tax=Saccharopolyspora rectivirgula TaxID=28042 RepID=UPI002409530F|nr:ROK family protein [Saccharopolyspora rectivirgula]